jgi:proline iminopeptidase
MNMKTIIVLTAILHVLIWIGCQKLDTPGVLVPPTVDEDPALPSQLIKVSGVNRLIYLQTYGDTDNPVLFVLHGSYTDIRPYENLCEGLSDKYYVIAWDQRGCGLSERITEEEFTLESAVEEINAVKSLYAPNQKISLIGHSWGGGLATLYTSKNPHWIDQLVLIEPMPLIGDDMQKIYKTIVDFNYTNQSWNDMARLGQAISPATHAQIDYRAMMILKSTLTSNYHCNGTPPPWPIHRVGGFIEYVRNKQLGNPVSGFNYDFTKGLENYPDTVLILGGSCSSLGYQMQLSYSAPHFTSLKVIEIKDAGHRMTMEKYNEVMTTLKDFLNAYQ